MDGTVMRVMGSNGVENCKGIKKVVGAIVGIRFDM
jgi:hypothetical protein